MSVRMTRLVPAVLSVALLAGRGGLLPGAMARAQMAPADDTRREVPDGGAPAPIAPLAAARDALEDREPGLLSDDEVRRGIATRPALMQERQAVHDARRATAAAAPPPRPPDPPPAAIGGPRAHR